MKHVIYILFLFVISLSSCKTVIYGENYNNSEKVKNLSIGMSKHAATTIMGDKYVIESSSIEEEGSLEILKYYSSEVPYLLHFLNGKLVVFNRYYPPHSPEHRVIIEDKKE